MIDIAVGKSRKETNWKNTQISWDSFVKKISKTHRTHETHAEYMAASKDRQDAIKDIGGFVGGYLIDGNRRKGSVKHRQLITLDIDYGTGNIWDTFTMFFDCAALIYSTHKHSKKAPRYRIVIPLNRKVSPEEYEAISRKIASMIGMQRFDATTFQDFRLMYWPSTSKDGVYFFEEQEGRTMKADRILDMYTDWTNIAEWPQCVNEKKQIANLLKKQEDPTEKKNLIGAFCRTYPISAAIESFLEDIYEDLGDGRYTYVDGSTAAGAICYDDLYLYSHHNTDPAGQMLCNAFDLVRIHKYGHLDTDPTKPVTKQESYTKMLSLANTDAGVMKQLGEFAGLTPGDWLAELDIDKAGNYNPTIDNLVLIMANDADIKGKLLHNLFDHRDYANGIVPWPSGGNRWGKLRELTDRDDAGIRHYCEKKYGIFSVSKAKDALDLTLSENSFHPIKEYLETLEWDGVQRVDTVFIDSLGAEDCDYIRAVTRKTLVAAIARIYVPGIKFDNMLTLVGGQGLGKSTVISELAKSWFSDSVGNIHTKEAYENLQGIWIMEWGELTGIKKAEVETVKNFISKPSDRFRVAFGKRSDNFPRQCIFIGSTNEFGFLRDPSGGRRFWPVDVVRKYIHGSLNIDQIWAEAKTLFEAGESLHLAEEEEEEANAVQLAHTENDDRRPLIEAYLDIKLPENWEHMQVYERRSFLSMEPFDEPGTVTRNNVCVAEIWCEVLKGELKDMTTFNTKYIHNIMQNMEGWETTGNIKYPIYGYQRSYKRIGVDLKSKRKIKRMNIDLLS